MSYDNQNAAEYERENGPQEDEELKKKALECLEKANLPFTLGESEKAALIPAMISLAVLIRSETLKALAGAMKKICPQVIPQIIEAGKDPLDEFLKVLRQE